MKFFLYTLLYLFPAETEVAASKSYYYKSKHTYNNLSIQQYDTITIQLNQINSGLSQIMKTQGKTSQPLKSLKATYLQLVNPGNMHIPEIIFAQHTIEDQSEIIKLQKKEIDRKKKENILLLSFLTIFMLLLLIFFNNHRKINRLSRDMVKERRMIAMEKHKLKQLNRTKDQLFALISHDLRSPVSSLVNYLDCHQEVFNKDDTFREISLAVTNLQLTLNNLLQWASVQIKNEKPMCGPVSLDIVFNSLLYQLQSALNEKKIHVTILRNAIEFVFTNEVYLEIILRNILSNAIKFTPDNGFIRISFCPPESGKIRICIRDSGSGIPNEKLKSIFNYPSSSKGTRGETGTGLGLTLSKELAVKTGIDLAIKSKTGYGTEISLLIPVYVQ